MWSSGLSRKRMLAPACVLFLQGNVGVGRVVAVAATCFAFVRGAERGAEGLVDPACSGCRPASARARWLGRIDAAEREVVEQLGAHAEVAVDLEHRPRVRPPVFGEDLFARGAFAFGRGRALVALLFECRRVAPRLRQHRHRREAAPGEGAAGRAPGGGGGGAGNLRLGASSAGSASGSFGRRFLRRSGRAAVLRPVSAGAPGLRWSGGLRGGRGGRACGRGGRWFRAAGLAAAPRAPERVSAPAGRRAG